MTDRAAELLAEKALAMNSRARISSPRSGLPAARCGGLCLPEFLIRRPIDRLGRYPLPRFDRHPTRAGKP